MPSKKLHAMLKFNETEQDPRLRLGQEDLEIIHDEAVRRVNELGDQVAQQIWVKVAVMLRPVSRIVIEVRVDK